jgi:hypothetical protein
MTSKIKELILLDDSEQLELDTFVSENDSLEEIFNMGLRFFRYGKYNISMGFFNEVLNVMREMLRHFAISGTFCLCRVIIKTPKRFLSK